jgi:hypothetical protein
VRRWLAALALVVFAVLEGAAPAVAVTRGTIADVQIEPLDGDHYVVRLRASQRQAFDLLVPGRPPKGMASRVEVRLYRARLGAVAELPAQPFGRVAFVPTGNHLVLRIDLKPGYAASPQQGRSPSVVEVRITR